MKLIIRLSAANARIFPISFEAIEIVLMEETTNDKTSFPSFGFPGPPVLDRVEDEFTPFLLVMNHRGERV